MASLSSESLYLADEWAGVNWCDDEQRDSFRSRQRVCSPMSYMRTANKLHYHRLHLGGDNLFAEKVASIYTADIRTHCDSVRRSRSQTKQLRYTNDYRLTSARPQAGLWVWATPQTITTAAVPMSSDRFAETGSASIAAFSARKRTSMLLEVYGSSSDHGTTCRRRLLWLVYWLESRSHLSARTVWRRRSVALPGARDKKARDAAGRPPEYGSYRVDCICLHIR